MEASRSTEIRVGIVSLAAIILLIVGIMLGKGLNMSVSRQTIQISLPTSGGLEAGSPVVVNGVKRGAVTDVRNADGHVVVTADVNDLSDIHADARARVTILEITGGKKVEITPGTEGAFDPARHVMAGSVAADIGSLVTDLGDVSVDVRSLVRRLDSLAGAANGLLADGTVIRDIRTMTAEGALLVTDLRQFVADNRGRLETTLRDAGSLVNEVRAVVKNNDPRLTNLLDQLDRTVGDVRSTMGKADGAIVRADSLIASLQTVVNDVRTNEGPVNKLLYDKNLARRLDSTFNQLDAVIRQIKRHGVNVNVGIGHRP